MKYADFTAVTRRVTLPDPTDDDDAIYRAARSQLPRIDPTRAVRLAGLTVSGFEEAPEVEERGQLDLFGAAEGGPGDGAGAEDPARAAEVARRRKLNAAVDALADKYGSGTVKRADLAGEVVRDAWPSHRRRDRA